MPELEQVLRAAPPVRRDEVAPARRVLLDALIGQKLLAEAAQKDSLDERPDVVQQLAAARRSILAAAYIAKIDNGEDRVPDADVAHYYQSHPGLFRDRMEFTVEEFALPLQTERLADYTKVLNDHGFDALKAVLAQLIPDAVISPRTLATSDLPGDIINVASHLTPGSDVAYRTGDALHLGRVIAVQSRPISLSDAHDRIVAAMVGERRGALISASVDDLKRSRHVRIVNADLSKLVAQ